MCVLVTAIKEEFVFLDRRAESPTRSVSVQSRVLLVRRDIGVRVIKIGIGVYPIRPAMHVSAAVDNVCARSRAHVDVRAAGGPLLRVIHRSVHAHFRDGFWSGGRNRFADSKIYRRAALHRNGAEGAGAADACVIHHAGGSHLACALAIEQAPCIHAVQQIGVARIPLAIGPDRRVPQPFIGSGPGLKLRIHTWGK